MSTRTPSQQCKSCFHKVDAATPLGNSTAVPKEGDVSICAYCGAISQYDREMNLVPASPDVIEAIKLNDPATYRMMLMFSKVVTEKINSN